MIINILKAKQLYVKNVGKKIDNFSQSLKVGMCL